MRTVLRSLRTGRYFASGRSWACESEGAWDFPSISEALEAVRRWCLRDMEVVLSDVPDRVGEPACGQLTLASLLGAEIEALEDEPTGSRAERREGENMRSAQLRPRVPTEHQPPDDSFPA